MAGLCAFHSVYTTLHTFIYLVSDSDGNFEFLQKIKEVLEKCLNENSNTYTQTHTHAQ